MGNGMNKVLPGLYLGNYRDAKDMEQLTKNNITHILAIHDNAQPVLEHLVYKCINAADSPDQEISGYFQDSIDFIHKCRLNNGACLVHCMAGVSRSTSLVAAYIMAVTQLNWRDAIKAIKCSRSIANPNYGFQRQLQDFCNSQASKQRERLRKDFPDTEFKDEEYLLELMANNEDKDVSEEDAIMNALCNHTTRTKLNSINKENQETSHENGEETSNKEQED
ncbi:Dual specificity protein phosphatase 22 [Desmophyllum pertusum]|uniref:Dual specificity protein phosphatase 15 n=1 Tax=Desmophyllum pertusum TaxID=174260 RepID=A0A9W9Z6S5_9CNID|nr:Dual specificity protein phosphatase 22 [Desmophyllum pertusum]